MARCGKDGKWARIGAAAVKIKNPAVGGVHFIKIASARLNPSQLPRLCDLHLDAKSDRGYHRLANNLGETEMAIFARSITGLLILVAWSLFAVAADKGDDEKSPEYWVHQLSSDDPQIRKAADNALIGDYAQLFEPPLIDDGDELAAREKITTQLKPQVPALIKLLDGKHDDSRVTAAILLAVIGADASAAEPVLLRIIRSKGTSGGLQAATFTALLNVTPRTRPVLPTLLELADPHLVAGGEDNEEARRTAEHEEKAAGIAGTAVALELAHSGRAAIEVPSLVRLTSNKYRRGIRLTVIYALSQLEAEVSEAVPALRKLLAGEDIRIRSAAGWALLLIEGSPDGLPAVLKEMQLDETRAAEFQKSISEYFNERAVLLKLPPDEAELRQLLRQAASRNPFYQRQAIRYLGELGPNAKEAVPVLLTAAKSEDGFTRATARAALKRIDPATSAP